MPFSHNGDFEQLVEQITDVIYARLNGHADDQAKMCGCTSECFHRCPERMHRVVDAGASRIGLILGQTASARDWAGLIDHTLLKPDASETEIKRLCEEAAQYHFASVCVNPTWVRACEAAKNAGADVVKTSTGFSKGGATVADVALMRRVVGSDLGVKASGGVKSIDDARAMVEAGATRIGASVGVKIAQEAAGARTNGRVPQGY